MEQNIIRILRWLCLDRFQMLLLYMLNFESVFISFLIVHFSSGLERSFFSVIFYVFWAVFSTIVVSLSCPLYVIAILRFCAFWTNTYRC